MLFNKIERTPRNITLSLNNYSEYSSDILRTYSSNITQRKGITE